MRILAVIPACEGSKSFPNKNMRIIHGKPMMYYVVNNALQSKYITDIIVTTNSNEIASLARQMNVMTRHRRDELCNEKTSLDRVIYDVFEQLCLSDYDYVVTMQSISPTLRWESLDKAFEQLFADDLDTIISVKNVARFYWTLSGAQAVPMQKERMNRHMLPPYYVETGAFVISKSACIRPDSCIGEKVGLYELSGDEAIDVNDFGDLWQVEHAMIRYSTAIFVNGNYEMGLGHISRVVQLADELFTKPDIYFDRNITDPKFFGSTSYSITPVDGMRGFVETVSKKDYDVVINDILSTDESYMRELRNALPRAKLINFEDEGSGAEYANVVINALYESSTGTNAKNGSQYYILPKLFLVCPPINIAEKVQNVLITFGGADPQNYTDTLLEIVSAPKYKDIHFHVVLGSAKKNVWKLMEYEKNPNISILYNIDNMPEIMSLCDMALTSRGRTCFELAALGIPTISIPQHDREARHLFVCEGNGYACLDVAPEKDDIRRSLDKYLHSSRAFRQNIQNKLLSNDLRNGRKNVINLISSLPNS